MVRKVPEQLETVIAELDSGTHVIATLVAAIPEGPPRSVAVRGILPTIISSECHSRLLFDRASMRVQRDPHLASEWSRVVSRATIHLCYEGWTRKQERSTSPGLADRAAAAVDGFRAALVDLGALCMLVFMQPTSRKRHDDQVQYVCMDV
jgi:hypothetical protein